MAHYISNVGPSACCESNLDAFAPAFICSVVIGWNGIGDIQRISRFESGFSSRFQGSSMVIPPPQTSIIEVTTAGLWWAPGDQRVGFIVEPGELRVQLP